MTSLVRKALQALTRVRRSDGSRGTITGYTLNAPAQFGQPRHEQAADVQGLVTPQRMREVVMKTPTAAACLNATLDYAAGVCIDLRNTNPAEKAPTRQVKTVRSYMNKPNGQDTWRRFLLKLMRDLWTMGYAAIEQELDADGNLANLHILDAARLYIDFDEHGEVKGYDMLDARGVPIKGPDGVHAWLPDDLFYFALNPVSSSLYPTSRISQLFTCAVLEDLMIYFISQKFTDSNIPYGVYDLGDISEDELNRAVAIWNDQSTSNHRIMLTGSKQGGKWNVFGYHLKDLEAVQLLAEIRGKIMAIVGVTMNELGDSQDINKANGYNLSFTFKKRAIEPLLDEIISTLTQRLLWDTLHFADLEFFYEEIDSRDELLQAQIDEVYLKMGAYSINHVRNRKGLPSTPGGDEPNVFSGSAYIPVSMITAFAQAQLTALQAVEQAAQDQGANGDISPPIVRGPQPPEHYTTPDAPGSSTVKIRYPQPEKQQAPRGPVQTSRNMGQRKEDLNGR